MPQEDITQNIFGEAIRRNREGDYRLAAKYFALSSLASLFDGEFQPSRRSRIAFGTCLRAISAADRGGHTQQGRNLWELFEPAFNPLRGASEYPVLNGLIEEWYGDAFAMLGDERCLPYYRRALEAFETHASPGTAWGTDEEFDYAFTAFQEFTEDKDITLTEDHPFLFPERVEAKIDFVHEFIPNLDAE